MEAENIMVEFRRALRRARLRGGRGFALITVVAMLSMALVLLVSMLGLAETELRSSAHFGRTVEVRAMSEVATNLVIAQIRSATYHDAGTVPVAWSSQPGALHTWDAVGGYRRGYKLYSDSEMVAGTAAEIFGDMPEANWDAEPGRYADLNEPVVVRQTKDKSAPPGTPDTFVTRFPVVDPRAAAGDDRVEGFGYRDEVGGVKGVDTEPDPEKWRLPMPVEWIYLLRDGTVGTVEESGGVYAFRGAKEATVENPIVGRVAYWADDETSKLNVNTATEPTPWDTPRAGNLVDYDYGRFQPAQNEWQRYPGHPASTGLGPVLFPNRAVAVVEKEELYKLLPRVREGGTNSGTAKPGAILVPDGDRLFATMEEMALKPDRSLQTRVAPERVEMLRYFLTAQSRAPELNAFGYPRVAIWPVGGAGFTRTVFDNLIAFCSTVGGKEYCFQRLDANSATKDWTDIARNRQLYAYLQRLTSTDIPGVGKDLAEKWGDDRDQILTEVFDYIRAANLREKTPAPNGRVYASGGQVTPIQIPNGTKGFGRFFSISEFGLHFICNGDGDDVDGDGNRPDGLQPGDAAKALQPGERYVECALLMEPFCPSQGFYIISNNFSVRVSGLENFRVNGEAFGFQAGAFRAPGNLAGSWHGRNWGGPAGVRTFVGNAGTGYQFRGRNSVKVKVTGDPEAATMEFSGGQLTVEVFYGNTANAANLVQMIEVNFPAATFPVPKLVQTGTGSYRGATARPKEMWWSFGNRWFVDGVENTNSYGTGRYQTTTAAPHAAGAEYAEVTRRWPGTNGGFKEGGVFRLEDVVRSLVPAHGDMRLVAGLKTVPATVFQPHRYYTDTRRRIDHLFNDSQGTHLLYGFSNEPTLMPYLNGSEQLARNAGFDPVNNPADKVAQLTPVEYHYSRLPDVPWGAGAFNQWGDFDNGVAQIHDGAYINKPDEGNVATKGSYAYFAWNFAEPTEVNFSPNRMMPSPGMFGSLPTGVKRGRPWETLLFRPQAGHPGEVAPHDHELLDLFWMPVIEPWAVSEPFSTSGKVNLNHAIAPFSYITRTTALRGVFRSEEMLQVPNAVSKSYKLWDHETSDHPWLPNDPSGNTDAAVRKEWGDLANGTIKVRHRIDADQTLEQLAERFAAGKPFRSASEICEVHLVGEGGELAKYKDGTHASGHVLSGDNTRERPYTNLYPRLTVRSNTFRVHVRAQVIAKARSADAGVFDPERDTVAAEYRGSTLVERYIDPNDVTVPDYATVPDAEPLTRHYKFRVVEQTQFLP